MAGHDVDANWLQNKQNYNNRHSLGGASGLIENETGKPNSDSHWDSSH